MSRFDFLKDKIQPLYEKCTQAEQATDISVKMLKIRQTLEYLVRELGEDGKDLFNNIGSLSDRDILDETMSRLFQRTRMITNRGIHENHAGSITSAEVRTAMDNLAEIAVWYAVEYKKQSFYLNDFASEDVSIAKRYLGASAGADTAVDRVRQTARDTVNVDPLAVVGSFDDDDDAPVDPLEKDVFETDDEYAERIAQMGPIHIGYGILDMRKGDGYTNVHFLQHHLDKNRRVRFTQSPVYFFVDQATENSVIDGELVAKLRVHNKEVYCDYSCIFLRSDEVDIPVQVICWDKLNYESEADYQKRIEALPILPLALCKPIRSQYDIKQQILPFKIQKYSYVHISMEDTYGIPCNRDLAKQVTAQKEIFTMFGKVQPAGFIVWNRTTGVLFGTPQALEAKQKEEQQENNVEIEKALEQLKYKREERERQLREQRERKEKERQLREQREREQREKLLREQRIKPLPKEYSTECFAEGERCWSDGNYKDAFNWYWKAASQNYANAQYMMGLCYEEGRGIAAIKKEAIAWYEKAAKQGHSKARNAIERIQLCEQRKQEDRRLREQREREERERQSREKRDHETKTHLMKYNFELGECCEKAGNYKEAIKWYQKAADQGHEKAKNAIERIKGYQLREQRAREARDREQQSKYEINIYLKNADSAYEEAQAIYWYRKAAILGSEKANKAIKCIEERRQKEYIERKKQIREQQEREQRERRLREQREREERVNPRKIQIDECLRQAELAWTDMQKLYWYRQAASLGSKEAQREMERIQNSLP